ncbi:MULTISPECIES: nucleotide pyrophosphohydrolase [unclassified Microbulbifer]|uniref:nucleotide pyrophosphohydrolase n=1 Tax=unclassified Microbulbifer TaxID=2619833 RepID=UPI0027E4BE39|nr:MULTISPECIES: nucleotide pyrophosphohydrolase [unclassified Microbulbifer]
MDSAAVLAAFDEIARRRNWQSLHTPKNLAMALSVEVAELCRHLQWRDDGEVERMLQTGGAESVAAELADIQMYLLKLAAVMDIDLDKALADKIAENRRRF